MLVKEQKIIVVKKVEDVKQDTDVRTEGGMLKINTKNKMPIKVEIQKKFCC